LGMSCSCFASKGLFSPTATGITTALLTKSTVGTPVLTSVRPSSFAKSVDTACANFASMPKVSNFSRNAFVAAAEV